MRERVDADGDADDMRPRAICVTGATASLTGDILVHEHLLFDFTSRLQQAASPALANDLISLSQLHQIRSQPRHCLAALRSPGVDVLMQELAALRDAAGPAGCTVVDCTVVGRDAEGLLSLSQLTKVNIIMAAGVSVDEAMRAPEEQPLYVSGTAMQQDEPVDEMADRLVAELTSGITVRGSATAVRAGILTTGEVPALAAASSLTPELARARTATLRALGRAQLRTGAPILCPLPACPGDGSGALEGVQCLIAQGARAGSIIVAHAQNLLASERREALPQLLRLGVTLCFDGLGDTWSVAGADYVDAELAPPPTDSEVAREVAALAAAGHAAQLVLSHAVSSRLQLATFGGAGLTHVSRSFLGRLGRANLSEVDVDALRGGNAARLLSWWRPPERVPRQVKVWECNGCHARYEEAAHLAEALPTDHEYYEKFDKRYCSMHCMGQHRKANFVAPFSCAPP